MTTFDDLLTWRESSTTAEAISAALGAARQGSVDARELLAGADRVVVTGAGSSFYLAQTVAAAAREAMRRPVMATPLSELILRPEAVLVAPSDDAVAARREPVVIISRSGSTSEAVTVAERMRAADHPTIAVTCRLDSPLADAGRRDPRLARRRRGGDRDDPVIRQHARPPPLGRGTRRRRRRAGVRPGPAAGSLGRVHRGGLDRTATWGRPTGAGSSSWAADRRTGSPPSGA